MSTIWNARLDKVWLCEVTRVDASNGRLLVRKDNTHTIALDEQVSLSYDAQFGPDVADVAEWSEKCMKAVDDHVSTAKQHSEPQKSL